MAKQRAPIYLNKNQKFEFTDELSNGKIPAIVLKKAFSLKTCKKITQKILNSNYITDGPGIDKKIGESLNSYLNQKETYFKKTELTDTKLENYFDTIDDPRIVMQKLLSIIFQKKISVAKENNLNYSKGVFRVHSSGTFNIHRDCARFEASNYKVSNFPLQFSATLHLQKAECGGELILYKKFWQQEDEKYRFPHFGYSKEVVTNTEFLKIKPDVGDIIIINPLHYHTISEIKGMSDRVSTGFFFAPSDEHALVCWS